MTAIARPMRLRAGESAVRKSLSATRSRKSGARRLRVTRRQILRVDRVGLHQNFFDLGGHSLLLVKLQIALKKSFGQEISIVELFQRTTVAAQAERCANPMRGARARAKTRKIVHG
jgi:acyl carrier protein